jgi:uncharacterized protein YcbK (DUF882 family)
VRGPGAILVSIVGLGVAAAVATAWRAVPDSAAQTTSGVSSARATQRRPASRPKAVASGTAPERPASPLAKPDPRFVALKALRVRNVNSDEAREFRLYDESGHVDESAARGLDELLCDARDPDDRASTLMDRRLLQLAFRAAYHFRAREITVISGYRKPGRHGEGLHAKGTAIDFKLPKVNAAALASYLRTLPRVGVGVYTHPRTQFVHLDVRDHSYHWIDASPPGKRWRERSIGGRALARRDLRYRPADDWPEGTAPPVQ